MANEFYTLIVVPHAKARFRKFQVSVKLTKWVLTACGVMGLVLVGILAHYTWIAVEVAEVRRLRVENLALAAKARAYEENAGQLQAKVLQLQSVVTKLGLWLMPEPECYMPGWLTLRRDADLELLLEELRPLMLSGIIQNQPMIINAVCGISAFTGREQWYTGAGVIPDDVVDRIAAQPGLGRWVMRFALYGDERIVERQREIVSEAVARIPGAGVTFAKYRGSDLPELTNPHERVQAGIPSMDLDRMTRWYGGEQGGHIGFSCVAPITGRDGVALRNLVSGRLAEAGLDYSGVIIVGRRSMIHIGLVVFDTKNEAQARAAYDACKSLVAPAARLGYGEYRAHLDFMDLVADQYDFNRHAQRRFHELLKDTLDPNGILSPGKQGIWPRAYRE